ncbi:MAG: beta propeller repeat protein [Planctomycetota bacterium]|jgi:hypothetical protein
MLPPQHHIVNVLRTCPGRAVLVQEDGTLYISRHYRIYRSSDDGQTWTAVAAIPRSALRRAIEASRLACRLLRHEVRALLVLENGMMVASSREGVFYAPSSDGEMRPSSVGGGSCRWRPPIRLCAGPGNGVLWGEYWRNSERGAVRLFASNDAGRSFDVAYVFEPGMIRHVHNVLYDRPLDVYWVLAGDYGDEPGIGCLSADLKDFDWLVKGAQQYRAVCVFDRGDHLLYGTDTETERNFVMCVDKATGRVERLTQLEGSCIHACRFGGWYTLTTSVEPSSVNTTQEADIWVSRDGEEWRRVFSSTKDGWDGKYFQYGSLVMPGGASGREILLLSGQALKGMDGKVVVATLSE